MAENTVTTENKPDDFPLVIFRAAFVLCSIFFLFVIWSTKFLVLQDLPDHIARAAIMKDYFFSDHIRHYFRLTFFPVPYLLPDILNALLLCLFNTMTTAKLYATIAAFSMIAGSFYCIRRIAPSRFELAIFPFVFVFSNVFIKGNLNFCIGLGLLFWLLGYWWPKRLNRLSTRQELLIMIAGLLLYSVHLICLFAWFCIFGLSFLWRCAATRSIEWKKTWPIIPSLIIMIAFLLWNGDGGTTNAADLQSRGAMTVGFNSIVEKYYMIMQLFGLSSAKIWYLIFAAFLLYGIFAVLSFRKTRFTEEWLIFSVLSVGFLFSPQELPNLVRPGERIFIITLIWGLLILRKAEPMPEWLRLTWMLIMFLSCSLQGAGVQEWNKRLDAFYASYYEGLQTIPRQSLVCAVPIVDIGYARHFHKYCFPEKQAILPDLFAPKHICLRYRHDLPFPPSKQPTVTDEMLRFYDYFIVFGKNDRLDELITKGVCTITWNKRFIAIVKNNTRR